MSEYKSCPPDVDYIEVQGPAGPQGPQGLQGPKGVPGPAGPQGPQGLQGPEGCRGPKGDRGPRGEKGDPGRDGRDGAPGPQGPQGVEGPRGCKGNDGSVKFELLTPEQRKMITGPAGAQGPEGPQGLRGPRGYEGPEGPRGEKGENGVQGPAGTPGAPGERGPMGPQGPRGLTGPKGDPGDTRVTPNATDTAPWSSKRVIDYVTHGNINWEKHRIDWSSEDTYKVLNTANGYAKNIKVEGNTVINYSNLFKDEKIVMNNAPYNTLKSVEKTIFNKSQEQGNTYLQGVGQSEGGGYTLIYKMDGLIIKDPEHPEAPATQDNFEAKLTVASSKTNEQENVRYSEFVGDVINGYVKIFIPTALNDAIQNIKLKPFTILSTASSEESMNGVTASFTVKDVLLLKGDYRYKIPPEYFHGEKGVGINKDGKFIIRIETRNKNLISVRDNLYTNYYLKTVEGDYSNEHLMFRTAEKPGSVASFIVYCKPNTQYTFSMDNIAPKTQTRLAIAGFSHEPGNGELGKYYYYALGTEKPQSKVTFTTDDYVNVLVIYVANFDQKGSPSDTWHLVNRCKSIQLEEGRDKTAFVPFESSTRDIIINQQLKTGEYLYWNEAKGKYYIHVSRGVTPSEEPTDINEEELIHTYNGGTYTFIRSKIPSVVEAEYPIKAHVDYYTKEQTESKEEITTNIENAKTEVKTSIESQFAFNDESSNELAAIYAAPKGFRMAWQEVNMSNLTEKTISFPNLTKVIHAQATPIYSAQDNTTFRVGVQIVGTSNPLQVKVKTSDQGVANRKVFVLAIGDARQPVQVSNEEQEQH